MKTAGRGKELSSNLARPVFFFQTGNIQFFKENTGLSFVCLCFFGLDATW